MTTHPPGHRTHSSRTWALATCGALSIAGLIAAMVWVVQGQVQQAQVLRAQWQGTPRAVPTSRADAGLEAPAGQAASGARPADGDGLFAASFGRP